MLNNEYVLKLANTVLNLYKQSERRGLPSQIATKKTEIEILELAQECGTPEKISDLEALSKNDNPLIEALADVALPIARQEVKKHYDEQSIKEIVYSYTGKKEPINLKKQVSTNIFLDNAPLLDSTHKVRLLTYQDQGFELSTQKLKYDDSFVKKDFALEQAAHYVRTVGSKLSVMRI